MAELTLGLVGAAAGSLVPSLGISAWTGFQIGTTLGSLLFPPSGPKLDRGKIEEVRIQGASQGSPIPIIYGRNRTAGTVIWASGVKETSSTSGGGKGGGSPQTTDYSYSTSLAIAICEGMISKIRRIWANEQVIYDWRTGGSATLANYLNPSKIRIYLGNQTLPDSAIEADKGVGNVPAHKGLCYIVFEDLPLAEFGNQVPSFTFEIEPTYTSLQQVFENLCSRVAIPAANYDFSNLASYPIRGLLVPARTEAGKVMEMLAIMNQLDIIESQGKIKSIIRNGTSVQSIPSLDIGASADDEPKPYVETTRQQEIEIPREFSLNYQSEANDFLTWSQTSRRFVRYSQEQGNLSVSMAPTDEYARYMADALLMEAWTAKNSHSFTLPYKYLFLDPGDVISIPDESGNLRLVRIIEMNAGLLSEIEIKAIDDDPVIYSNPGNPASIPSNGGGGVINGTNANRIIFESNAPYDGYANDPFIGSVAGRSSAGWSGGYIEASPGVEAAGYGWFNQIGKFTSSSTFGFTTNDANGILAINSSTNFSTLDTSSTVRVTLTSGSLVSCTYDELITQNKNLAIIGKEIFQFQTATLISGTTYQLSNLLRGRRGTDYLATLFEWGSYTPIQADSFALINDKMDSFAYALRAIGGTHSFRLIENGKDYSAGLPAFLNPLTLGGLSRKPYGPSGIQAIGNRSAGNANITISWNRRVRIDGALVDYSDAPLDELEEAYEVEIWNNTKTTLLRTQSISAATSWIYTIANQTSDGVNASTFFVLIYQKSRAANINRGFPSLPKLVTLTGDL